MCRPFVFGFLFALDIRISGVANRRSIDREYKRLTVRPISIESFGLLVANSYIDVVVQCKTYRLVLPVTMQVLYNFAIVERQVLSFFVELRPVVGIVDLRFA